MKHTRAQQKLYRVQAAALDRRMGYDDEARRDVIARVLGGNRRSTASVSVEQMAALIAEQNRLLRAAGAAEITTADQARPRKHMTQDEYIAALVDQLGWTDQPERLGGMIRRVTGGWRDSVALLDRRMKSHLITGLRRLAEDIAAGRARAEREPSPWYANRRLPVRKPCRGNRRVH